MSPPVMAALSLSPCPLPKPSGKKDRGGLHLAIVYWESLDSQVLCRISTKQTSATCLMKIHRNGLLLSIYFPLFPLGTISFITSYCIDLSPQSPLQTGSMFLCSRGYVSLLSMSLVLHLTLHIVNT